MTSRAHKDLVDYIKEKYKASEYGFRRAIFYTVDHYDWSSEDPENYDDPVEEWWDYYVNKTNSRIIPDAYKIIPEKRLVIAFEAEITNGITENKRRAYYNIDWFLDVGTWWMQVVVVNKFKHEYIYQPFHDHFVKDFHDVVNEQKCKYEGNI